MSEGESEFILAAAKNAECELIPTKSKKQYEKVHSDFCDWKSVNILAYFYELSKKYKPSSLWAYYSMLKAMLKLNCNIDISVYYKLNAFLSKKSRGYTAKKAKILTEGDLEKFIKTASSREWLDVKVACIFALNGTLRSGEMYKIKIDDVERKGADMFLVNIPETKTNVPRKFVITGPFVHVVEQYISLRRPQTVDPRFFVNYREGRCTIQPIGINKMYKMPEKIAKFLQLPDPKLYTGHSFRRSSATVMANGGATKDQIMRAGGWKSEKIAESYVEASISYKKATGDLIASSIMSHESVASQGYIENMGDKDDSLLGSLSDISSTKRVGSNDGINPLAAIHGLGASRSINQCIRLHSQIPCEGKENETNGVELDLRKNLSETFSFTNCEVTFFMK